MSSIPTEFARPIAAMANNPGEAPSDDFLEQILGFQGYATGADDNLAGNEAPAAMMLQLGSSHGSSHLGPMGAGLGVGIGGDYGVGGGGAAGFPLGLSLEQGKAGFNDALGSGRRFFRDDTFDSRSAAYAKPVQFFEIQCIYSMRIYRLGLV